MTWLDRFWSRVDTSGECWTWAGYRLPNGYGRVAHRGNTAILAHRLSWELANTAEVPDGLFVCHHCDVRACVNPAHLFVGTHQDNMTDMITKGRRHLPPRPLTIGGETMLVAHWARRTGVSRQLICQRLNKGLSPAEAVQPIWTVRHVRAARRSV